MGDINVTKACEADIDKVETGMGELMVEVLLTDPNMNELVDENNNKVFKVWIDCTQG